jgi:toxin secretion/phage lysis holin
MYMSMEPRQEQVMRIEPDIWWKVATGAIGGFWAGLQFLSQTMLVLMAVDIVTGVLASLASGEKLSSKVSFRGLAKKVLMVISVGIAAWLEPAAGGVELQNAVAGFWCANELLSIIENYGVAKLPIPDALRDMIAKLSPPKPQEG